MDDAANVMGVYRGDDALRAEKTDVGRHGDRLAVDVDVEQRVDVIGLVADGREIQRFESLSEVGVLWQPWGLSSPYTGGGAPDTPGASHAREEPRRASAQQHTPKQFQCPTSGDGDASKPLG